MFFIIGNPRSGTSLFRLLLTSHSDIHIPPESGFMIWWQRVYNDWNWDADNQKLDAFLDDLFNAKKFEFWELDREPLSRTIKANKPDNYAALSRLIYEHHSEKAGKKNALIGDKNNFHLNHIAELDALYPDAKFVHIIRDGRDVATSYMDMSKIDSTSDYRPRLPSSAADIGQEWRKNIESVRSGFSKLPSERTLEIRYEDLVLETEKTLTGVCEFLGQTYEPAMLDFYMKNQARKLEPDEFMAWKARTRGQIDSSAIGKWKNLPQDDIGIFEKICGDILTTYNYELSDEVSGSARAC